MKWPFSRQRTVGTALTPDSPPDDVLRAAFEQHEALDRPEIEALGTMITPYIAERRWENFQKYAKEHPRIAEIVTVQISHTSDTNQPVIKMRAAGGKRVSLWCVADGPDDAYRVKSVTYY